MTDLPDKDTCPDCGGQRILVDGSSMFCAACFIKDMDEKRPKDTTIGGGLISCPCFHCGCRR